FFHRQEVDQKSGQSSLLERFGHEPVPRTVSAAAASVCEQHNSARAAGNHEVPFQKAAINRNANRTMALGDSLTVHGTPSASAGTGHIGRAIRSRPWAKLGGEVASTAVNGSIIV